MLRLHLDSELQSIPSYKCLHETAHHCARNIHLDLETEDLRAPRTGVKEWSRGTRLREQTGCLLIGVSANGILAASYLPSGQRRSICTVSKRSAGSKLCVAWPVDRPQLVTFVIFSIPLLGLCTLS